MKSMASDHVNAPGASDGGAILSALHRNNRARVRLNRLAGLLLLFFGTVAWGQDLPEIRASGVLRHLGIPYANFVTGSGAYLQLVKKYHPSASN